jgi:hypothetical protein
VSGSCPRPGHGHSRSSKTQALCGDSSRSYPARALLYPRLETIGLKREVTIVASAAPVWPGAIALIAIGLAPFRRIVSSRADCQNALNRCLGR